MPLREHRSWWVSVWELGIHVLVGSALFAVIFVPAVALDLVIHWAEGRVQISVFLKSLLIATKYAIAVIDAAVYVVFMLRMSWVFVRELFLDTAPPITVERFLDGDDTDDQD